MSAYLGYDCFVCVFMIWFSCFVVSVFLCFGFLVAAGFLLFCRNSTSFPVFTHIPSGEQRNSKSTPLQIESREYQINHHPNAEKHYKQFVELARCERVMATQEEFHFSWVYTFSSTPRSLRIWATHPPRETVCDAAPSAQLCWSSISSFPHICTTTSWNWTVTKLI